MTIEDDVTDVVKAPNSKTEFTEEDLVDLMKCSESPLYFMCNFMQIQHPLKGSIQFEPYPFQIEMITAFHEHRKIVCLTSRQQGKTTCAAGYILWKAMFSTDTTTLIAANTFSQAMEIMDRIRYAYENLPNHIRAGVRAYNKGTLVFDNGSRIIARATTPNSGRGLSISLLYLDEFAFVPRNISGPFWTSMAPVLSTGGQAIITSTPLNSDDSFATIWKGANNTRDEYGNELNNNGEGSNGFFAFFAPWWRNPTLTQKWADEFRQEIGDAKFAQEFECRFVSNDSTLVDGILLSNMHFSEPIEFLGTTRWYQKPQANKIYVVALDPSLGVGRDNAAIQIFQLPEMRQIGEWQHNKSAPRQQVRVLMQTLIYLESSLLDDPDQSGDPEIFWTVENNSIGEALLTIIEDTGEDRFPGVMISEPRRSGGLGRRRKGLTTTNKSKLSACARLKSLIETGRMSLKSRNLIAELKNFVAMENSFKAKPGETDDLVSATLMIVRMLETVMQWSNDTMDDLKENIQEEELSDSEFLPFLHSDYK